MVPSADWSYPTEIRFGPGRITELAEACRAAGIAKPLMVTDAGLAALPQAQRAYGVLQGVGRFAGLFADVRPNPTGETLAAGIKAYRAGGHDGVVAYGGGSALDLGKLIALMARQTRPIWAFDAMEDQRARTDETSIDPVIAVPTTAGTGSAVSRTAVLTNRATGRKTVIVHPKMRPVIAIADPELTLSMAAEITAGTGMTALAHALEAFCARDYHPMSEGIAMTGIGLVKENLPRVLEDATDIAARGHMLSASLMGAVAGQRGLGAVQALAHPIGGLYDTPAGMTKAVLLPYVLAANRPAIDTRMQQLAGFLGLRGGLYGVLKWLVELRRRAGVPHALPGLRVDDGRFGTIAEMALQDPGARGNPLPLTTESGLAMLRAAYDGQLPV